MNFFFQYKYIIALVAGSILPFSFAPFNFFLISPISLSILFLLWIRSKQIVAFRLGFIFGFASFSIGLYWLYISIHHFGGVNELFSLFLLFCLISILSFYIGFIGWFCKKFFRVSDHIYLLFIFPLGWTLVEWLRGWLFSGFGWLSLGYSQSDSWIMSLAPVGGLHLMSLSVLITAGGLSVFLIGGNKYRLISVLSLASIWGTAFFLEGYQWTKPSGSTYSVSIVQGSISQDLKWRSDYLAPTLDLYRDLIFQSGDSSLIILPEVALPIPYEQAKEYLDELKSWSKENDSLIMLGILKRNYSDNNYFNALVSLDDQESFYAKKHIVPFGEYMPLPDFAKLWVRKLNLPYSELSKGPSKQEPIFFKNEKAAISICYEDVFGAEQLHYFPESTFLINLTNDAWFGDSIAPHQHLQISKVRAAEVGRFILRSANTGISAIINQEGEVINFSPQFEPYILKGEFSGFEGMTFFSYVGNKLVITLSFLFLIFFYFATKFNIRLGT